MSRHESKDQKFWEMSQKLCSLISLLTLGLQENQEEKKSFFLHDRLFLELGSFISARRVLLFTVQLLTTHQHSLFKSRLQLEGKTLKQPEMLLFFVNYATRVDF